MEGKLSEDILKQINEKLGFLSIVVITWFVIWIVLTILQFTIFK